MSDFAVRLDPTYGPIPPALKLMVNRYRASVFGGPESCDIASISGPEGALWETLGWVFRGLEIYNDLGTLVWWGFVNSVVVNSDGLAVGLTLDGMYNRIAAVYSFTEANGATDAGATAWQEDALSIGQYGYKEQLMTVGEADEASALAEIAHRFNNGISLPQRLRSLSSEGRRTQIGGVGWWETLRWRYFKRLEGRVVWLGVSNGAQYTQNIGWGVSASNRIGFAAGSIQDLEARIGALQVGDKVAVSGSTSNNRVYSIAERASGPKTVYTASTIRFDPADDILDSAQGLAFIQADHFIQVQGSVNNSRYHLVSTTGADHITVNIAVTGYIANEFAGPSITITHGQQAIANEAVSNEVPGASVTLTQYGNKVAQRVTPDHAFTVDKIALSVGKTGSPVDNLQVSIYSDVAGLPGVLLVSTSLAAAAIATQPAWTWFDLPNTLTVVAATPYWIVIERTGALSDTDYFTLRLIAESYGTCLAWTGTAWTGHPQVIDGVGVTVPFQLWGAEDTLLQIKRVITDAGQWFTGIDDRVGASGRLLNQYVGDDLVALDVAEDLIAKGMSDGRRIFITVTPERVVRIEAETVTPDLVDRWMRNGKVGGAVGGMRERGVLPVGEWLALEAVPVAVNAVLAISPAMVDAAEYSPASDELAPEFKSLRDEGQG